MRRRLLGLIPALFFTCAHVGCHADEGLDAATKDTTGATLTSHVPGCVISVTRPEGELIYTDRSLQAVPITHIPVGQYQALDYKPGWFQISAMGWIAWIKDDNEQTLSGVALVPASSIEKQDCPGKNE